MKQTVEITSTQRQLLDDVRSFSQHLRISCETFRWQAECARQQTERLPYIAEPNRDAARRLQISSELSQASDALSKAIAGARNATDVLVQSVTRYNTICRIAP